MSEPRPPSIECARMNRRTLSAARRLIGDFLGRDEHYRSSAAAYGDGGPAALERALELFLDRPELGFVWLAFASHGDAPPEPAGACVVCFAISTARGSLVAKLDDVTIAARWRGRGVGTAMIEALAQELVRDGATRIDCGCHRDNADAWRFYHRLGFAALNEERLARVLVGSAARAASSRDCP